MWGKFVDHVVDTAYSRSCTADAHPQVGGGASRVLVVVHAVLPEIAALPTRRGLPTRTANTRNKPYLAHGCTCWRSGV